MSVSIEVCKDVEQFQESVVAGMDAKHTLFAAAGIAIGSITGGISHLLLHLNRLVTMYLVMFTAIPVIFIGFLDKDGMNILERIKKGRAVRRMGTLYYVSTENSEYFKMLIKMNEQNTVVEKTNPENMTKRLKLLVLLGLFFVLLLVAVVLLILFGKR